MGKASLLGLISICLFGFSTAFQSQIHWPGAVTKLTGSVDERVYSECKQRRESATIDYNVVSKLEETQKVVSEAGQNEFGKVNSRKLVMSFLSNGKVAPPSYKCTFTSKDHKYELPNKTITYIAKSIKKETFQLMDNLKECEYYFFECTLMQSEDPEAGPNKQRTREKFLLSILNIKVDSDVRHLLFTYADSVLVHFEDLNNVTLQFGEDVQLPPGVVTEKQLFSNLPEVEVQKPIHGCEIVRTDPAKSYELFPGTGNRLSTEMANTDNEEMSYFQKEYEFKPVVNSLLSTKTDSDAKPKVNCHFEKYPSSLHLFVPKSYIDKTAQDIYESKKEHLLDGESKADAPISCKVYVFSCELKDPTNTRKVKQFYRADFAISFAYDPYIVRYLRQAYDKNGVRIFYTDIEKTEIVHDTKYFKSQSEYIAISNPNTVLCTAPDRAPVTEEYNKRVDGGEGGVTSLVEELKRSQIVEQMVYAFKLRFNEAKSIVGNFICRWAPDDGLKYIQPEEMIVLSWPLIAEKANKFYYNVLDKKKDDRYGCNIEMYACKSTSSTDEVRLVRYRVHYPDIDQTRFFSEVYSWNHNRIIAKIDDSTENQLTFEFDDKLPKYKAYVSEPKEKSLQCTFSNAQLPELKGNVAGMISTDQKGERRYYEEKVRISLLFRRIIPHRRDERREFQCTKADTDIISDAISTPQEYLLDLADSDTVQCTRYTYECTSDKTIMLSGLAVTDQGQNQKKFYLVAFKLHDTSDDNNDQIHLQTYEEDKQIVFYSDITGSNVVVNP